MSGATLHGLSLLLPTGTDVYVGLFTSAPSPLGTDGTEVDVTGYARVACDSWANVLDGSDRKRANVAAIEFAAFEFPSTSSIVAVGIWDASSGGNLIAWLAIDPIEDGLTAADQLRFTASSLALYARA